MKTIFLPGYSPRNRDWQNDIISALPQIQFIPVSFRHWQEGIDDITKFDYEAELEQLTRLVLVHQPINLLAKSIGTVLAMRLLLTKSALVSKTIFCGLPINSLPAATDLLKQLSDIPNLNLTVIQNTSDPVGAASDVFPLVKKYLPTANCVETNRDDHHYPFPDIIFQHLTETQA